MKQNVSLRINGELLSVNVESLTRDEVRFELNGRAYHITRDQSVASDQKSTKQLSKTSKTKSTNSNSSSLTSPILTSPMSGIIHSILVTSGQEVAGGEILVRVEAMKMQNTIIAPRAGKISQVLCSVGDEVSEGDELLTFNK
jgi:glutaconyl-CoA/methylmalonyl-CoA decarboxylase subunit gamma